MNFNVLLQFPIIGLILSIIILLFLICFLDNFIPENENYDDTNYNREQMA
jgi:hypothetical protein